MQEFSTGPYYFDPQKTSIIWTAYKYTSRLGVSGELPNVKYTPGVRSIDQLKNVKDIFSDFHFECDVDISEEGSASIRNLNIQKLFFDKLSTPTIHGKLVSGTSSLTEGNVDVELTFNGVKRICSARYTVVNNTIELTCTVHLADFDAIGALNTLHEGVSELHTGPDGISITWPDVDI